MISDEHPDFEISMSDTISHSPLAQRDRKDMENIQEIAMPSTGTIATK